MPFLLSVVKNANSGQAASANGSASHRSHIAIPILMIFAAGVNGRKVTAMTKREQMIECMEAMEDGMIQTAQHSDIWQNRLIYWLCKAVYLLLEQAVKGR